jgi:hypothetical protein
VGQLQRTRDCVVPEDGAWGGELESRSHWQGSGGQTFTLVVNALPPQKVFVFCFVVAEAMTTEQATPIIRDSLSEASQLVLGDPSVEDVTGALAFLFQSRLANGVTAFGAGAGNTTRVPPGNIFHPDSRIQRGDTVARLLFNLVDPYQGMVGAAAQYETRLGQLRKALPGVTAALTAAQSAAISAAPQPLIPREDAFRSDEPFPVSRYNLTPAKQIVNDAQAGASSADLAALQEIGRHLNALELSAISYGRDYDILRQAARQVIAAVEVESTRVVAAVNSTVLSAEINRAAYVSLDTGIAFPWDLGSMVFYAGTNIYLRPVNKNAPLSASWLSRLALVVGITTTVKDDSRRAEDLRPTEPPGEGSNSLLIGAGIRVTPSVRISGGALIFRETNPNPLITRKTVVGTPFVALSLDVDLGSALGGLSPSN